MVKIFITGCAKSGTTLLKRMFHAFDKTYVIKEEVSVYDFIKIKKKDVGDYDFVVAKRSWDSLFSYSLLNKEQNDRQRRLINDNNIKVINIIRDGRDVVLSFINSWGLNGCFEWMNCVDNCQDELINLNVKYEELVLTPNGIQNKIMQLGFSKLFNFSDYPVFIPEERLMDDIGLDKEYHFRPLDIKSINKNPEYYKSIKPNDIEHFNKLLSKYGYA